jgi:translation initiation factor IF-2
MVSKKLKGMLVVAAAGAMMVSMGALAQAPGGGPPGGGPPRAGGGGPGGGGGFGAPQDAAGVIQRFGLAAPELKLTDAQNASIKKLADVYVADMAKLPPMQQGQQPDQAAMAARQAPRTKLIEEVGKLLTPDQKKTFDAAQAAQAQRRGGGGGPPGGGGGAPGGGGRPGGGGMGGPPGGGPPGGA